MWDKEESESYYSTRDCAHMAYLSYPQRTSNGGDRGDVSECEYYYASSAGLIGGNQRDADDGN